MLHFRFDEKGNLEVLLFTIQSKMRANNQRVYLPREGRLISDINKAWEKLEKAEHERELALREELIRSVKHLSGSFFTSSREAEDLQELEEGCGDVAWW